MQALAEISKILQLKKLKPVQVLTPSKKSGSKHYLLFKALIAGKVRNDKEAKNFLKLQNSSYAIAKMRFKEKLLNLLLFLHPTKDIVNLHNRTQYRIYRNLFFAKTLMLLGALQTSMEFSKKVINECLQNKLYIELHEALQMYLKAASLIGNTIMWEKYNQLYFENSERKLLIEKAQHLYTTISYQANVKRYYEIDVGSIQKYITEINQINNKINTPQTYETAYLANCLYYQIAEKYSHLIRASKKYLNYIQQQNVQLTKRQLFQIYLQMIIAYFHKKRHKDIDELAQKIKAIVPTDTKNYLYFLNVWFISKMHAENYEKSASILKEALDNPQFKNISHTKQESWQIGLIYNSFALKSENKPPIFQEEINLGKFMNSVPIHSKDKTYMNVQIRIAQILIHLIEKDYTTIHEKVDALIMYDKRCITLKNKEHYLRSHYMILLIVYMARRSFMKGTNNIEKLSLYKKLIQLKPHTFNNNYTEIIPYETLLKMIEKQLR
jgi:hypothetical protein